MRILVSLIILFLIISCSTSKVIADKERPLYEILVCKSEGGAKIKFFEIISEPQEFIMIKNDPELKGKIETDAISKANFLILSLGEKPTGGYFMEIEKVEENVKNIIITIKEIIPDSKAMVSQAFTTPYCLVRINSKKEIIIK